MVGSVTNGYAANPYLTTTAAPTTATTTSTSGDASGAAARTSGSSVNVTLSAQAQAALAAQTDNRTTDQVVASARTALDKLLAGAKSTSALKDGKATIDVSGLDRRSLYAIASNKGGKFPIEEQVVASLQMKANRDSALSAPASAMRVTGDYAGLYKAALANLEAAGPEEKAMGQWAKDKAALTEGLKQAQATPGAAPTGIDGDPVAAYLKDVGGVVANPRTRDIGKVASDVRSVLDKQYAAATKDGMATGPDSGRIDFSKFDDRSLAAVALNKGDQFSEHEAAQAAAEVKARNRDSVSSAYKSTQGSDSSAFGKSLITQYAAMSDEERQAAGWTPALYDKMVQMQNLSDKLASLFNSDGGVNTGGTSLLDYL
ncbi:MULTISPECIES: hypothetical protein [Caulobacter]|jgi:hypothetical protein|uniref:hypothetical protein n=1 Tax=Caulobacter TaxID=75 RepID=UPI0006FC014C|nr:MULTISPECIES: hypothetical protein [Caulobacter]KQZ22841.1 hypothetical protein ASD47_24405 [Caulobacter sp. Root1472]GGL41408.1 hypothetical protein GCM10010983_43300 [Caulobacter rhizosphaerae]